MNLRMASALVKSFVVAAAIVWFGGAAVAQGNAATTAAPSGQYKIAVVNRKTVFDDYTKKKLEWDALEAERKRAETDLNARLDQLQQKKKAYDDGKAKLTDEQRSATEGELNKSLRQLQADGDTKQAELSKKGERIIKKVTGEINSAIESIGKEEGYHLILEADTAISSVVFFQPALDITSKVSVYVNSHAGIANTSAAAPSAPVATAKDGSKNSKDSKENKRR